VLLLLQQAQLSSALSFNADSNLRNVVGGAQVTKNCSTVIEVGNQLLAAARESQDLALASVLMDDFTELTANQAKRLTMATQVNVLKLEKDLER